MQWLTTGHPDRIYAGDINMAKAIDPGELEWQSWLPVRLYNCTEVEGTRRGSSTSVTTAHFR
jgi:hypothetical protein